MLWKLYHNYFFIYNHHVILLQWWFWETPLPSLAFVLVHAEKTETKGEKKQLIIQLNQSVIFNIFNILIASNHTT